MTAIPLDIDALNLTANILSTENSSYKDSPSSPKTENFIFSPDKFPIGGFPFIPALSFGKKTTGITYESQKGSVYRILGLVYISINIILSSKGSAQGPASILGLPFASSGESVLSCRWSLIDLPRDYTVLNPVVHPKSSSVDFQFSGENVPFIESTDKEFNNHSQLFITGFYRK